VPFRAGYYRSLTVPTWAICSAVMSVSHDRLDRVFIFQQQRYVTELLSPQDLNRIEEGLSHALGTFKVPLSMRQKWRMIQPSLRGLVEPTHALMRARCRSPAPKHPALNQAGFFMGRFHRHARGGPSRIVTPLPEGPRRAPASR
jgi:hypothetical protein